LRRTTVIAVALALVIGLAGSATAASLITSADIKNGTIKTADLSASAKRALKGKKGARGPAGAQGAAGTPGSPGAPGPAGPTGVAEIVTAQGSGVGSAFAACPAGMRPLSGGGIEEGSGYLWASGAARNDAGAIGWLVAGDAGSDVTAFAYCSAGVSKFTFPNGSVAKLSVERVRAINARR